MSDMNRMRVGSSMLRIRPPSSMPRRGQKVAPGIQTYGDNGKLNEALEIAKNSQTNVLEFLNLLQGKEDSVKFTELMQEYDNLTEVIGCIISRLAQSRNGEKR